MPQDAQRADYLESRLLRDAGFQHAFFTRRGGVSSGPYASLNFSVSVGDGRAQVGENLRRAAAALGVDPNRLYFASQVHGREAFVIEREFPGENLLATEADAVLSRLPELACGVRTADCVPILIGDAKHGAVAAVHAGWRGVVAGIVAASVERLRGFADEGELVAAIGPHISCAAFEVSNDVATQIEQAAAGESVVSIEPGRKPHVDLRRAVRAQLHALGVRAIDDVGGCTAGEPDLYFSFRRDGPKSGRHLSVIVPRVA
jgi:polyphenol oxidase